MPGVALSTSGHLCAGAFVFSRQLDLGAGLAGSLPAQLPENICHIPLELIDDGQEHRRCEEADQLERARDLQVTQGDEEHLAHCGPIVELVALALDPGGGTTEAAASDCEQRRHELQG